MLLKHNCYYLNSMIVITFSDRFYLLNVTTEVILLQLLYSHDHDQLYKHIIHIPLHMHSEHNDTMKTSDTVLRKIYLSLY